jgi:hypothetical protein
MRQLRLLIIAAAAICVLALGVLALVNQAPSQEGGGDVIIIKGGSLEVQCGKNLGTECLGSPDKKTGRYKASKQYAHITNVTVRNVANANQVFYSSDFDATNPPQIEITYTDKPKKK